MTDPQASSIPAPPTVDSLIGLQIDGCTIQKRIGQGGMGIVYLAEHPQLRQQYVVKVLNPALTAAEDTIQRFFREAQSVARLNHPSIVSIQNVGQQGDYYYIRMEYVDGDTVENLVKQEKKLEWKAATKIAAETAEALSHAHKKGIIHRDIKPENIMFTKNGQVKVMDFGLAKQVQAATKVSITGQIVGTPFFMSPEQAGGKTTDARSDIYSLGVTYYYLLTGVKPFNGKNLQEIFLKHFFYTPESPKIYTPELPEDVCEIIRRCLKKKKKERYQSAAQLARDLRIILGEEPGAISSASTFDNAREDEPSASQADFQSGGPGLMTDTAAPAAEEREASDLAAAQAEIGGTDDASSTLRVQPKPDAEGGAPSEEAPADGQPLQRRTGRVSLEKVAAASLVFTPKAPAPETPAAEGEAPLQKRSRVALEEVAGASMVFEKKPAGGETGEQGSTAVAEASPDAAAVTPAPAAPVAEKKVEPAPEEVAARKSKKLASLAGALVLVLIVAGLGVRMATANTRFKKDQAKFDQYEKVHPHNESTHRQLAEEYTTLAGAFDSYVFTLKQGEASELATKCRAKATENEAKAEELRIANLPPDPEKIKAELEKNKQEFEKRIKAIQDDEEAKRWDAAAQKAVELETLLSKKLPQAYGERIVVPIHVVSDPGGAKVYEIIPDPSGKGQTETLLGETPRSGQPLLVHARALKRFKLEIRRPRFKTVSWEQNITEYVKITRKLERDVRRQFSLGETEPFKVFNNVAFKEPFRVVAPFVLDSQALYCVSHDGSLHARDRSSGRSRWISAVKVGDYGDPMPGPDVLAGTAIVTASPDGKVRAFEVQAGQQVWERSTAPAAAPDSAASPVRGLRIAPDGDFVAVGTEDGHVLVLDAQNGEVRWRQQTTGAVLGRPEILGDRVYTVSKDDKLRVFDAKRGELLASYDAQDEIVRGPVILKDGNTIHLATRHGAVHVLSAGEPAKALWASKPVDATIVSLLPTADSVYFATPTDVYALQGGNQVWVHKAAGTIVGLARMHESLCLVTTTGKVEALDERSGTLSWTFQIPARSGQGAVSVSVPPVVPDEDLYVVTSDGEFFVIAGD